MFWSMPSQIIRAARALTSGEELADATVVIEDGQIVAIGRREEIVAPKGAREYDARAYTIIPGFVDVHIHGAGAHDVMEATPEALETVAATVARHGTTAIVATTVTAPTDATCRSLEGISRYIRSSANKSPSRSPLAQVMGIHLEGPFIHPERRGVHPTEWLAQPSVSTVKRFLEAADGCARILTLAPELPGALEVIDAARAAGLTIALGHTDATYQQAEDGVEHGARHAVHVFNAMRPFSHRETGVIGATLTDGRVTAEVIADGVHVATGMPDGVYRLGPFEVTVSGGVCRNAEGRLAGSTLTLDRAVRHLVGLGVPLRQAVQMATSNAAKRVGLEGKKGVLAPGADADLVLLNDKLEVAGVVTRGTGL